MVGASVGQKWASLICLSDLPPNRARGMDGYSQLNQVAFRISIGVRISNSVSCGWLYMGGNDMPSALQFVVVM